MTTKHLRAWAKERLPPRAHVWARRLYYYRNLVHLPRVFVNKIFFRNRLLRACDHRIHIGCNTVRVPGFVNVDVRPTAATDFIHDCGDVRFLKTGVARVILSNAFFEHIRHDDRVPLLRDARRALRADGKLVFAGIPDFEAVARLYLDHARPGIISPVFDIEEAYRYTHGKPEDAPEWWMAQLHKSLFDVGSLAALLHEAGFRHGIVFSYHWGDEPHAVTIGCIASEASAVDTLTVENIAAELEVLPNAFRAGTLQIRKRFAPT